MGIVLETLARIRKELMAAVRGLKKWMHAGHGCVGVDLQFKPV
jgi:hypothetical protein